MVTPNNLIDVSVLPYSGRVIVGVSGGIDSVSLLHLLCSVKHEYALDIIVAHYDHALRSFSSQDTKFVSSMAQALNVPFISERNKVKRPKGVSIEEFARERRYGFLIRAAKRFKAHAVVLAHTQDDLAETVLIRILRGSGLSGLRSMLPSRMIGGVMFLRPLLSTKRSDLEAYMRVIKADHIDDPTNTQDIFLRNRIRHVLIPFIQKNFAPAIKEKLAELSINAAIDYDVLDAELHHVWPKIAQVFHRKVRVDLDRWLALPLPIRRMVLREAAYQVKKRTGGISFSQIAMIETLVKKKVTPKRMSCSAGLLISISDKFITLS